MRTLLPTLIIGMIFLYFLDAAFQIDNLNMEMFTHNAVRFVTGFVFLGIWVWSKHKLRFKVAMYFILALLVSDDIVDYIRDINNLNLEMFIHDTFVLLWGAVIGFFHMRNLKRKNASPPTEQA